MEDRVGSDAADALPIVAGPICSRLHIDVAAVDFGFLDQESDGIGISALVEGPF